MRIPNKRELQQIDPNHLFDIDFKNLMKLYKYYTEEPYSFLVNHATLLSDNPLRFENLNLLWKWVLVRKIKRIDNKVKQNKAKYNLDRQTAKIFSLSPGTVRKYEFLTDKDVLLEKDLLEKAATIKKVWIFSVRQRIKSTKWHRKNQYQKLGDIYELYRIIKK